MEPLNAPPVLKLKGNVALPENWALWRQQLQIYMTATELDKKCEERKVATLLNLISMEGLQLFNTFDFDPPSDKLLFIKVLEKFEAYCAPRRNMVYEHYKFFSRSQLENETSDQFLTDLKLLASTCEFADRDTMLLDRMVLGTIHKPLQERFLREPGLTLLKAMELAHAFEITKVQLRDIQKVTQEVDKVTIAERPKWRRDDVSTKSNSHYQRGRNRDRRVCDKCGYDHAGRQCPAINRQCNRCKTVGHFATMCDGRRVGAVELKEESNGESESTDIVWEITSGQNVKDWEEHFLIKGKLVKMKIDTGSQVNILTNEIYATLCGEAPRSSQRTLISYTGHRISHRGIVELNCEWGGLGQDLRFYIADTKNAKSLIGLEAARFFGMTKECTIHSIKSTANDKDKAKEILTKFGSVFGSNGKLKKSYNIRLKEGANPVSVPPRKIPVALQHEVKCELESMVKQGILVQVTEPTEWTSPIVLVRKPNKKLRICMDPRNLNKYVLRERCWIPTIDTVLTELAGARVFTVLDASNAFHQVPLNYASSLLCTIATPYGRYRYTRLPYGLSSAPEVFQHALYNVFDGLKGVINYIDDIVIFGVDLEEHNQRLHMVLEKIQAAGLRLSDNKIQLAVGEISYLGHIISSEGIRVDPKKTEAIVKMKTPQTKKELQRFLGMITYLAKHLPLLSQETTPLRSLLSKKNMWTWEPDGPQAKAFDRLKQMVSNAPIL